MSGLTVLVAARDEEDRIGPAVGRLREAFPEAVVVVADDGSRDGTASIAERAGARVVRFPRRGKISNAPQAQGEVKYHDVSQIEDEIARFRRCSASNLPRMASA